MDPGAFADYELSKRTKEWAEKWPYTAEAITAAGSSRGKTMSQLQSRVIGAQVALELQHALPTAA